MWIFSTDPNYGKLLESLGIDYTVHKGVRDGVWIPAYHISDSTPLEKIEELKAKERELK